MRLKPPIPSMTPKLEPRLSEAAASIGQRILDLEEGLTRALARNEELERALELETRDNERLKITLDSTRQEQQRLFKVTSSLEGHFNAAAKIILEAIDIIGREHHDVPTPYVPKPEAVKAMTRAIMPSTVDDGRPIPEFLNRAPDETRKD